MALNQPRILAKELSRPIWVWFVVLTLVASFFAINVYSGKSDLLDIESEMFFLNYIQDRGVIEKVFDVRKNDWDCYQARELSYFVDYLDATFIALCAKFGWVHFYSISHFLFILLIISMHFVFTRKYFPQLSTSIVVLLALIYATNPSSYITNFFRSAKILTASLVFFLIYYCFIGAENFVRQRRIQLGRTSIALVMACLMTLADRQGFFFSLALLILSVALYLFDRRKHWWIVGMTFLSAATFSLTYNFGIGPNIIYETNGYLPDFTFQNLEFLNAFFEVPLRTVFGRLAKSTTILFENADYLLGGFYIGGLSFFTLAIILLSKKRDVRPLLSLPMGLSKRYPILIFLAAAGLLFVMNLLMVYRADYVMWEEHKLVYYWIPTTAILFFASTCLCAELLKTTKIKQAWVQAALGIFLLSNIVHIPSYYATYTGKASYYAKAHAKAPIIKACAKQTTNTVESFNLPPRASMVCRALRGETL